jgi:hypothetical protein
VKYLEALPLLTQGKGTTVFLPVEASGVMAAIGGIKELLARSADKGAVDDLVKQIPPAKS